MDPMMLKGRVALVTGSGRGMGRAHAVILAQHGADVVVHDIFPDRVAESAGVVRQHGGRVMEAVTDVADPAAMEKLVAKVQAELGPISILVNNAGIGADRAVTWGSCGDRRNQRSHVRQDVRRACEGHVLHHTRGAAGDEVVWQWRDRQHLLDLGHGGTSFWIDLLRGEGGDPGLYQVVGARNSRRTRSR